MPRASRFPAEMSVFRYLSWARRAIWGSRLGEDGLGATSPDIPTVLGELFLSRKEIFRHIRNGRSLSAEGWVKSAQERTLKGQDIEGTLKGQTLTLKGQEGVKKL